MTRFTAQTKRENNSCSLLARVEGSTADIDRGAEMKRLGGQPTHPIDMLEC